MTEVVIIPTGYRKVGPDEIIQAHWFYWNRAVKRIMEIRSSYIGRTLKTLLKMGYCTSDRIILEKTPYPVFEGWIGIGVDAKTEEGDRVVITKPTATQKKKGLCLSPETGKAVDFWLSNKTLRELYPLDRNLNAGRLCVYRRIANAAKARRFPPGSYAQPLPLP